MTKAEYEKALEKLLDKIIYCESNRQIYYICITDKSQYLYYRYRIIIMRWLLCNLKI
jgi:hypothetical protein